MVTRNGFLGQVRVVPQEPYQSYPSARMTPTFPGTSCPPGKMPFSFADRTICVDSGFYPVGTAGAEPAPPGMPEIQPPIETSPQPLEDIGPEEPPPVPSTDELYPYGTSMAPEGEDGCPPGQYHPTWSARCIPKSGGGLPIGAFGGFGMAPSAPISAAGMGPSTVPFTMGRAMLGRVRLVKRPF